MLSETPLKRKRGANRLNCAECRRLKLRCDRAIPCSSCIKRGCGAICPTGTPTTGKGNRRVHAYMRENASTYAFRYIPAPTVTEKELDDRISLLSYRILDLEDALRVQHATLSPDIHPLLTDELLCIKASPPKALFHQKQESGISQSEGEHEPDAGNTPCGSLSTKIPEKSRYYGHTASSWHFLQNDMDTKPLELAAATPLLGCNQYATYDLHDLLSSLPSLTIALALREIYYVHATWLYNPISTEVFDNEICSTFYNCGTQLTDSQLTRENLSILFMVLAMGSLMDVSLPPFNIEAERYHQLAKAALFQTPLLEAPSFHSVQALFLMNFYLFLAERHGSASESRWAIMGMAIRASQAIGLHRDGSRWGLDAAETQRRRELFWEIFACDSLQSLTFGRPPAFQTSQVSCRQPHGMYDLPGGEAFHAWKHRFTSECISILHDQAFGARGATYAKILELDKKIRDHPVPSHLDVSYSEAPAECSAMAAFALQCHNIAGIREIIILCLHRSFFATAMLDFSDDPLSSPYRESVEAAFHSAQKLIATTKCLYTQFRGPCERMWFLWTHLFSCAVILTSIVTRSPGIYLAPSALAQLDTLCSLFSNVASSFQATDILKTMFEMQRKAHAALKIHQGGRGPPLYREDDDGLAMLKGNTSHSAESRSPHLSWPSTSMPVQSSQSCRSSDRDGSNYASCPSTFGSDAETSDYFETPTQVMTPLETFSYIDYSAHCFQSLNGMPSVHDTQPLPCLLQRPEQVADHHASYEVADSSFCSSMNNAVWDALIASYFETSDYSN